LRYLIILLSMLVFITGCSAEKTDTNVQEWTVSPSFEAGNITLYGNQGRLGIIRQNGDGNDLFNVGAGRLYGLYFWGNSDQFKGKYKLVGVHKETEDNVQLYEWDIQTGQNPAEADAFSGGKFGLDKAGLWRLDVYVGDELFDSIVVDVK